MKIQYFGNGSIITNWLLLLINVYIILIYKMLMNNKSKLWIEVDHCQMLKLLVINQMSKKSGVYYLVLVLLMVERLLMDIFSCSLLKVKSSNYWKDIVQLLEKVKQLTIINQYYQLLQKKSQMKIFPKFILLKYHNQKKELRNLREILKLNMIKCNRMISQFICKYLRNLEDYIQ